MTHNAENDAPAGSLAERTTSLDPSVGFEVPEAQAQTTVPASLHDFLPVAGHPDDDECTHREDGTDSTYCGLSRGEHECVTPPGQDQP